jgi:protein pelota
LKIKNTKAMEEITIVNKYNEVLGKDYERIIFGLKHIEYAIEQRAVDLLLVTDDYLRKIGGANRKRLQEKIDKVLVDGGVSKVLSCMLPPGERINSLGGLTAILKYKLNEIDDMDNENENYENYENNKESDVILDGDDLIEEIQKLGIDEIEDNDESEVV